MDNLLGLIHTISSGQNMEEENKEQSFVAIAANEINKASENSNRDSDDDNSEDNRNDSEEDDNSDDDQNDSDGSDDDDDSDSDDNSDDDQNDSDDSDQEHENAEQISRSNCVRMNTSRNEIINNIIDETSNLPSVYAEIKSTIKSVIIKIHINNIQLSDIAELISPCANTLISMHSTSIKLPVHNYEALIETLNDLSPDNKIMISLHLLRQLFCRASYDMRFIIAKRILSILQENNYIAGSNTFDMSRISNVLNCIIVCMNMRDDLDRSNTSADPLAENEDSNTIEFPSMKWFADTFAKVFRESSSGRGSTKSKVIVKSFYILDRPAIVSALRNADENIFDGDSIVTWGVSKNNKIHALKFLSLLNNNERDYKQLLPLQYIYLENILSGADFSEISKLMQTDEYIHCYDMLWYLLDMHSKNLISSTKFIWLYKHMRVSVTKGKHKNCTPTVPMVVLKQKICAVTSRNILRAILWSCDRSIITDYQEVKLIIAKQIFKINPIMIYGILMSDHTRMFLHDTEESEIHIMLIESNALTIKMKRRLLEHLIRYSTLPYLRYANILFDMPPSQIKNIMENSDEDLIYQYACCAKSSRDLVSFATKCDKYWHWNTMLVALHDFISKPVNNLQSADKKIYQKACDLAPELFKTILEHNKEPIHISLLINCQHLFNIQPGKLHEWLLETKYKFTGTVPESSHENIKLNYAFAHLGHLNYHKNRKRSLNLIASDAPDLWVWIRDIGCNNNNIDKIIDLDEYYGAMGHGPYRELYNTLGELVKSRVLIKDDVTGTLVPRADALSVDLQTTGAIIYRSIVDGFKLQIDLHPALLVLLTVNFIPHYIEWSFIRKLLSDEILDQVSPRTKFSNERIHLLEDALARFPEYRSGFLDILRGFERGIKNCYLTPTSLGRALCDPISDISSVLKRTRLHAPENRIAGLYAAINKTLATWSPEDISSLYIFWLGTSRAGNFGISDEQLARVGGSNGLLHTNEDSPMIIYGHSYEDDYGSDNESYSDDESDYDEVQIINESNEENKQQEAKPVSKDKKWYFQVLSSSTCNRQLVIPKLNSQPTDTDGMAAELEILLRNTIKNQSLSGDHSGATYMDE